MAEKKRTLPDYKAPPVIETVLGVQFKPLNKFLVPHFGLFWEKIRSEYPNFEAQTPLASVIERFENDNTSSWKGLEFSISQGVPVLRGWFKDNSGTQLIQVQNTRFLINWREQTGDEPYPHYHHIQLKFKAEWERFCEFLKSEDIGQPEIDQCEVTYVNHFEVKKEIENFGNISKVLSFWSDLPSSGPLQTPEAVQFSLRYLMPENKGRLHVTLDPKVRVRDGKEILQMNLTARGNPGSSNLEEICEWFNLGHTWIVEGFTQLTTPEMHKLWGRTL